MQYSVQFFTWTPREGVHQVGQTIAVEAVNAKLAAVTLLGVPLDETGASNRLAARVWKRENEERADCVCFFYH